MKNKGNVQAIFSAVNLLILAVMSIMLLEGCGAETTAIKQDASHQAPMATPLNTITTTPTQTQNAVSTVSAIDTEVAVGQQYVRPYNGPLDLKVVRVAEAPLISQASAIQAISNQHSKQKWALGDGSVKSADGTPVTLASATYGLVTLGHRIQSGAWVGDLLHYGVQTCTVDGKCTLTGEVLDHIENRLMWVFAYNGIEQFNHNGDCPFQDTSSCARLTIKALNHYVYFVDGKTLQTINVGFY